MPKTALQIEPFTSARLAQAQELLAREQIQAGPLVPDRQIQAESLAQLAAEGIGTVALAQGQLQGFLLAEIHQDPIYGISARVPLHGLALSQAEGRAAGILRQLYAQASDAWVAAGALKHQLLVAVHDRLVIETCFGLGFGREQVHGLLPLEDLPPAGPEPAIRRAGRDDLEAISPLLPLILEAYARGPIWEPFVAGQRERVIEAYGEILAALDPAREAIWIAEAGGKPVAFAYFAESEAPALPDCWKLVTAATAPSARGQGWQRRLLGVAAAELLPRGVKWLSTDWRSTSLSADETWPALGYRPVALRLSRRLPPEFAAAL